MKDVMIDLETLGSGPNACIIQIGACYFDRKTGEIGKTFKINVDGRTSQKYGGEIDADTIYWWLRRSKEAITSVTAEGTHIFAAMEDLNAFIYEYVEAIWSHATFDFVIVMQTLKALKIKPSFSHRVARDIRTLLALAGEDGKPKPERKGVHHDALDDCIYQVGYCVEALNKLTKI